MITEVISHRANVLFSVTIVLGVLISILGASISSMTLAFVGNGVVVVFISILMVMLCVVESKRKRDHHFEA